MDTKHEKETMFLKEDATPDNSEGRPGNKSVT
jgi:hypothetical protein